MFNICQPQRKRCPGTFSALNPEVEPEGTGERAQQQVHSHTFPGDDGCIKLIPTNLVSVTSTVLKLLVQFSCGPVCTWPVFSVLTHDVTSLFAPGLLKLLLLQAQLGRCTVLGIHASAPAVPPVVREFCTGRLVTTCSLRPQKHLVGQVFYLFLLFPPLCHP